jgi:hypothetical protein
MSRFQHGQQPGEAPLAYASWSHMQVDPGLEYNGILREGSELRSLRLSRLSVLYRM